MYILYFGCGFWYIHILNTEMFVYKIKFWYEEDNPDFLCVCLNAYNFSYVDKKLTFVNKNLKTVCQIIDKKK